MFKNIYYTAIVLFTLMGSFSGCKKDLGNYDYQPINEVNFGGIEKSYTAEIGKPFVINPVLKFTKDENDTAQYTYEWYALNKDYSVLPKDQRKNLAKTKNLNLLITIASGQYQVFYNVTDKKTGITFTKSFDLLVSSEVYEGWMVLNDINGTARLDMVNQNLNVIKDVLKATGSNLTLTGKPLDIYCYPWNPSTYGIYVTTDKLTTKIDPETFSWKNTLPIAYEFASNVPSDLHVDFIKAAGQEVSYVYTQGNYYYYFYTWSRNYSVPVNFVRGENKVFPASPFIATVASGYPAGAILFDKEKQRFLRHVNGESSCALMPDQPLFNYNKTGMDLVFMDNTTYNGGEAFAILKNPVTFKYYLARISPDDGYKQNYYQEMLATDIDKAEQFAINPDFGYIFYSVGSKIYEYDMFNKTSKLMIDKGADKISLIKFQNTFMYGTEGVSNKFVVCSYNPGNPAESGKMELYSVPNLNANLSLTASYTGFGKIISVSYRERPKN